jgi:hypothetical protein
MTTTFLATGCNVSTDDLTTTSIECTTNEDGTTTCREDEDKPDGDEGTPGDGADLTCSGTGCVATCEYGDDSFHCSITCENGLTCESTCKDGSCEISCDCPDGGGGGGCEGTPTDECCRENPEDPACQPPCPDGSTDCGCQDNSEDPDCKPPCPDGSTDQECYCQQNPDDPECARCDDGSTAEECYCKENPDDPNCAP